MSGKFGYIGAVGMLEIRCFCGALGGTVENVTPATANRVACHCAYCEAHAHDLGQPERILDEWGGSERIQVSPATLKILGVEYLGCTQLTPKGALRWYTTCCRTPIALTLASAKVPFLALERCCIIEDKDTDLEPLVGRLRARVNRSFPKGHPARPLTSVVALLAMLIHFAPLLALWWWRGDQRQSTLFDATSRKPVIVPQLTRSKSLSAVQAQQALSRRQ